MFSWLVLGATPASRFQSSRPELRLHYGERDEAAE
jgi:hypothetical protein